MTIVADTFDLVIGVDTHKKTHTAIVIDARSGKQVGTGPWPHNPRASRFSETRLQRTQARGCGQ